MCRLPEALATEPRRNFSLAAFADLARRMEARSGSDSWARVFPRGRLLWTGLADLHRFVEAYFTGGGLMRPLGARAIAETADRTSDGALSAVAERYAALGRAWTDLTHAALPEGVPLLARTRQIHASMAAAGRRMGVEAAPHVRAAWGHLDELAAEADRDFPLDDSAIRTMLADLAARVRSIHAAELEALTALRASLAG